MYCNSFVSSLLFLFWLKEIYLTFCEACSFYNLSKILLKGSLKFLYGLVIFLTVIYFSFFYIFYNLKGFKIDNMLNSRILV